VAERHTIETYGTQPNNRNIWSSRLADSFVCAGGCGYTTTIARCYFQIVHKLVICKK